MSEGLLGPEPRHRVARFVAATRADLDDLADATGVLMTRQETASTLLKLTRLRAQVAEPELRVARHAATVEVGLDEGATSMANWWSHTAKLTRAEAHRLSRLAGRLGEVHEPVRAALATGAVLADQAAVIVDAVDALPGDLADPAVVAQAERVLLEHARDDDAKALRVLGRRVLDVVAPEVGEAHEARVLEAEEQAARAGRVVHDGRGRPRPLSGPVHDPGPARLDAPQAPPHPRPHHRPRIGKRRSDTGSGRRSASTSRRGPPPRSARPAASAPPSWSP